MGRAAPPARAPCAQRPWRILQHHSGPPSRSHRRRRQSPRPPLKGPSPGLCHGILSRGPLPCLPSPDLRLGERGAHRWPWRLQCHRGASLFLGPELGTQPSTVPWLGSGWGCGECSVWGPALSLTRVCLSSAPRCVPDPSARLARSLRPGECRQRRRPVLGAPGHAAAAAAELRAAVAPPARRPEMPRLL